MRSDTVLALGSMSGTSLDGVDGCAIVTDGVQAFEIGRGEGRPYAPLERETLRAALGRWPGEAGVEEAARVVEDAHAELLAGMEGDLVAFHGQTLAHEPGGRGTHQAGDGSALAERLGRPVVWDFRSDDVAMGGEGAPLAPAWHFACARWIGADAPVAFLNLGGVANLTWVDPSAPALEAEGALLAFDTGPANAPIDDLMRQRLGRPYDEGGAFGASGEPDEGVIASLMTHPFLRRRPPKSLDRDDFASLMEEVADLADADAAATLAAASAACVARGLAQCPSRPRRLLVTGGGRRNAALMEMLGGLTGIAPEPVEDAGLDGDMLEAQAFAFLAVRVVRGLPTSFPSTTGVGAPVAGGRLSAPR